MSQLEYREFPGPPGLDDLVERLWFMRAARADALASPQRLLPDGRAEIVFNLADRFRNIRETAADPQPRRLVVGPTTRHMLIQPTGEVDLVGIRICPGAMRALFAEPLDELSDNTAELSELETGLSPDLLDRLYDTNSIQKRHELISVAVRQAARVGRVDRRVLQACRLILSRYGRISIDELARETGASARTLERLFVRNAGMGPKLLARLTRFQRAIRATNGAGLLDAAVAAGYYDQSHFLRDFQQFAGVAPSTFFQRETNAMSGAFVYDEPDR
jgi:AraC-like DNA-binding protein